MNANEGRLRFEETQTFPAWSYVVLAASALLPLALSLAAPGEGRRIGVGVSLGTAPIMALLANLLYLRTVVDAAALTVTFGYLFPLYRRRIPLTEILRAEAVTYSPLGEYGGWGIRGMGENTALNARGNRGVRLTLADGRRVLIGSQRPEALAAALSPPTPGEG
jgi:hypothetical protein